MAVTLGIDLGTQATKVLIYDSDQRQILASESAPLNLYQDANGTAEQQTHWWTTAITEALAKIPTNIRQSIQALAVSGQQHGFVPLDEDGNSLAPVKLWCDTSTETECQQITEAMGGSEALFSTAGNPILVGYTASKVLNFRKNHPKSYARLHTILLPHDYVNFWLTGVRCMEAGDASGTGFMDVRSRHWSEEVLRVIDPNQNLQDFLPDIGVDNTFIGEVSGATAGLLGIPAGTPVAIGGGDNMMGAIGTGNLSNGRTTISLGTSGTVYAHSPVPIIDNHGHIAAFCSSTGGWLPLLCTMNCTVTTELIRNLLNIKLGEFDSLINSAECGAGGVLTMPFFNGERTPDLPYAKGGIVGLDSQNVSPANLLRSGVEGATFALRFGLEELNRLEVSTNELILTGGGANSAAWRQIVADVMGVSVNCMLHDEGAAFGAALQALAALESLNLGEDSPLLDHIALDPTKSCDPDPVANDAYNQCYKYYQNAVEAFSSLYSQPFAKQQ